MRTFVAETLFAFASAGITAGLVAASAPAAAADISTPRQVTVQTDDLNLNVPAGRTVAVRRIRLAADAVCATGNDRLPVDRRCKADAIGGATRALDARTPAGAEIAAK